MLFFDRREQTVSLPGCLFGHGGNAGYKAQPVEGDFPINVFEVTNSSIQEIIDPKKGKSGKYGFQVLQTNGLSCQSPRVPRRLDQESRAAMNYIPETICIDMLA